MGAPLAAVLVAQFRTRRCVEGMYWRAILFTFALGTAAGDLAAETLKLGYANSALIFAAMIGTVTVAYYGFRANAILAFWIAYILTRPLGASFGDLLSQLLSNGGLGWGHCSRQQGLSWRYLRAGGVSELSAQSAGGLSDGNLVVSDFHQGRETIVVLCRLPRIKSVLENGKRNIEWNSIRPGARSRP